MKRLFGVLLGISLLLAGCVSSNNSPAIPANALSQYAPTLITYLSAHGFELDQIKGTTLYSDIRQETGVIFTVKNDNTEYLAVFSENLELLKIMQYA